MHYGHNDEQNINMELLETEGHRLLKRRQSSVPRYSNIDESCISQQVPLTPEHPTTAAHHNNTLFANTDYGTATDDQIFKCIN